MNITKYKNIDELVEKKDIYLAQEIDSNQLRLITKGYIPTKFNIGINDVIEFLIYDASNNILPQESFGNIRYIKGEEIKKYLLISNNISDTLYEGGGFVVDIKKLIKEAGYNTGYFRVQINFVNNRVGSDYPTDKMWIQEISPTRFEMRLLPFNNFNERNLVEEDVKKDLNQSYDSFLLGKFSGDEVYQEIYNILDSLKASDIANMMKTVLTEATISKLTQEFNLVGGYDLFYARVLSDMKSAVINELLYRNSTIGSDDFGKPISEIVRNKVSQKDYNYYSKSEIIELLNNKFKESVNFHLPKRTLNENLEINNQTKLSLDNLNQVVQKLESETIYQLPQIKLEKIEPIQVLEIPSYVAETPVINIIPPPPIPLPDLIFTNGPTVSTTENSAVIRFTHNEEASAVITFLNGICPKEGCILNKIEFSLGKRVIITDLISNTEYNCIIEIKTKDGRTAKSAPITFTTLPIISKEPIYDPYTPVTITPIDYSGGGTGGRIINIDSDGNPDTLEGSIGDYTTQKR